MAHMKGSAALATLDALVAEVEGNLSTGRAIERFLDGETDGNVVLNALYGDALDEPVPERLLAILREHCR
jgi:hypothetical protein